MRAACALRCLAIRSSLVRCLLELYDGSRVWTPIEPASRVLPRDVLELKALGERQPELAPAVNLQVDLIEAVRRVQGRITTPWIETPAETLIGAPRRAASRCSSSRRSPSTGTTCGC